MSNIGASAAAIAGTSTSHNNSTSTGKLTEEEKCEDETFITALLRSAPGTLGRVTKELVSFVYRNLHGCIATETSTYLAENYCDDLSKARVDSLYSNHLDEMCRQQAKSQKRKEHLTAKMGIVKVETEVKKNLSIFIPKSQWQT